MNDLEMIEQIRNGKHDAVLKILYKEFPKVKAYILNSGGTFENAQEIFNDSLLLLIEKLGNQSFELTSKLRTFLYGIARFLWLNESRRIKNYLSQDWDEAIIISDVDFDYDIEREKKLQAIEVILDSITAKCKQILELFYYKQLSMKIIAEKLRFASVDSAKTQKYKCLEKAIQLSKKL